MKAFLSELLAELAGITSADYIEPQGEIEEGEEIISDLNDDLKALATLRQRRLDQLKESCATAHGEILKGIIGLRSSDSLTVKEPSPVLEPVAQHTNEHGRMDVINGIFWQAVCEAFPSQTMLAKVQLGSVAIRKGWKLVACPVENDSGVEVIALVSTVSALSSVD